MYVDQISLKKRHWTPMQDVLAMHMQYTIQEDVSSYLWCIQRTSCYEMNQSVPTSPLVELNKANK